MFKLLSTWQRTFLLAVLCCLVSLAVVVIALNLAVWGAPLPIFLFLLGSRANPPSCYGHCNLTLWNKLRINCF